LWQRRPGLHLVVRPMESAEVRARKLDQMRQSLTGAATVARQLGIDPAEAMRLFGEMLNGTGASAPRRGPSEPGREHER